MDRESAEGLVRRYFQSWLAQDRALFLSTLAPDIQVAECYGPVYCGHAEMERWFERTVDIDPAWLDNYRAKLLYLSPWLHGSEQKMDQFAAQCFHDPRPGSTTFIVTLEYLKMKSDRLGGALQRGRFLLTPAVYQMVSDGFDRYVERFPHSPEIEQYRALREQALEQPYMAIAI